MKSRGFSNARDDALMMTDADCEDHVQESRKDDWISFKSQTSIELV